jgi:NAD(P)-dependent dehydrogenase (short-subunit alcohol dehydrogenase family)
MAKNKTAIVTGASQGIGAAIVRALLDRGYNVVGNARSFAKANFTPTQNLVFVEGDIGLATTAEKIAETAVKNFGSIDHVVSNAGIFSSKPFTDYTADEFRKYVSTNLEGFIFIAQLAVKQMLAQGTGGSVTCITAALAANPITRVPAAIPAITKGGLDAVILSLASEYAKSGIRLNGVGPGVVDTHLHAGTEKDYMKTLSPMGTIAEVQDIADAVIYLMEARYVTGEVVHVDGGAHAGCW